MASTKASPQLEMLSSTRNHRQAMRDISQSVDSNGLSGPLRTFGSREDTEGSEGRPAKKSNALPNGLSPQDQRVNVFEKGLREQHKKYLQAESILPVQLK